MGMDVHCYRYVNLEYVWHKMPYLFHYVDLTMEPVRHEQTVSRRWSEHTAEDRSQTLPPAIQFPAEKEAV
jgi:hypothetical protein